MSKNDIVYLLRDWSEGPGTGHLCDEAANEIERLRAWLAEALHLIGQLSLRLDYYAGRGRTHWHGCEDSHPDCKLAKDVDAFVKRVTDSAPDDR